MKYTNKIIRLMGVCLVGLGLSSCMEFNEQNKLLYTTDSPSGQSHLAVFYDEPLGFSPTKIHIHYSWRNAGGYELIFSEEVDNDGASLRQSNVAINWQGDKHAMLTLSGQQQSDAYFEIDLEKVKPTVTSAIPAESVTNSNK